MWRRHLFCNGFLESMPSTPLNGPLRNLNTWRVSVGNRTLQRHFGGIAPPPQKKMGTQNYLFSTTSQLNGNFEGQYLRRGTRYKQSGNGIRNYEEFPTLSQNFMNFGSLTAKNRTVVFTHPPKSSSAWRRWPKCWPALRCANISSCCLAAKGWITNAYTNTRKLVSADIVGFMRSIVDVGFYTAQLSVDQKLMYSSSAIGGRGECDTITMRCDVL